MSAQLESERQNMSDKPLIHIVRVNIDPAHEDGFNTWYDEQHLPEILACPGWLRARRFVSLGDGPKYAAIYEVEGMWAYDSEQYLAVAGFGPFTDHISDFQRIQLRPLPLQSGLHAVPEADGSRGAAQ